MNRIYTKIQANREEGKKIFCAYVTLGFPGVKFTRELIPALEKSGGDILELGIPFSDPMADGPIIQASSAMSLARKTKVKDAFTLVRTLRKQGCEIPVVFFSYYNIIFHYGIKKFVNALCDSGFDGVLCPDLPPEEAEEIEKELRKKNIALIYLITPTTTDKRIAMLAKKSTGFIYYVSRCGVTGVQKSLSENLRTRVKKIKKSTSKSVLVGFGVSNETHVRSISSVSDGVIVGSAIIREIERTKSVKKVASFVKKLVDAL